MQIGLATPASRDTLLAGCVKALAQLQWGFDGHSSCLGELYSGLAQLFADQPAEPSAGASDRYGFETEALQSHFVPLLSADLAADGEKNTTGGPTRAAIVVRSQPGPPILLRPSLLPSRAPALFRARLPTLTQPVGRAFALARPRAS